MSRQSRGRDGEGKGERVGVETESEATAVRSSAFVGREREMAELTRALDDAIAGSGRLVLLLGEPGIGKTRIAEELAKVARERGLDVLWGRCHEGEGAPAYWPWLQIIRARVESQDPSLLATDMGAGASDIAQLVPEVDQRLPGLPAPPSLEPEQARFRLFDSVTTWLRNQVRRQALVILIDDLHLADRPSLLLLEFLAREMGDSHLLAIATYRDVEVDRHDPLARTLGQLVREPVTRRLLLRGFDDHDVARYLELTTGRKPPSNLIAVVSRDTEGNPFFVGEVVRLLADEGRLEVEADAGSVRISLPQGVRQAIALRIDHLSGECRKLLALASVVGREFGLPVVERLLGSGRERVIEILDEAVRARLVSELPTALGRYMFAHALVREALYAELTQRRRAGLHRQVGEVVEALHAADLAQHLSELAHHFYLAAPLGGADKAIRYSILAGDRASALWAYEEAALHYRRALEVIELEGSADQETRADCLLALGEAEMRAGDSAAARQTYQRAAEIARRCSDPQRLARAALGLGQGWIWGSGAGMEDALLRALLEESLTAIGEQPSSLRALLLARLSVALYWSVSRDRDAPVVSLASQAVAMARQLGEPDIELMALASQQWAGWTPENAEERLEPATAFVELADRLGDRAMKLLGHGFRLVRLLELGETRAVDREIELFAGLAEELRQPSIQWYAPAFRAMRATMAGDFTAAEALSFQALAIGQRARSETALQAFAGLMFSLRREQGRLVEIESSVLEVVERFAATRFIGATAWRCVLALMHAELGREEDARRELEGLAAAGFDDLPRDSNWLVALTALARVCTWLGDADRAAMLYEHLLPHAGRNVVASFGILCEGSAARYLGLLATAMTRWDEAERHFATALEANARMGARPFIAHTEHEYAAMLLARRASGDREHALELLDRSLETATALEMKLLAERVRALTRETLGAPPVNAAPGVVESVPPGSRAGMEREPGPSEQASTFCREGEYWTLGFEGKVSRMRDSKGLQYIAVLLGQPGREFHVLDLVSKAGGARSSAAPSPRASIGDAGLTESVSLGRHGGLGPILDARARAEYQKRLEEARAELEEAETFHDPSRAARARAEIGFIGDQLAGAVGLGGRNRETGSSAERARLMVTQRVKAAVKKIGESDPGLGRHLSARIKTGYFCVYAPDPDRPISWIL